MTKLYRSRKDSKLFGLCGGLAEAFDLDSNLLRFIVIITAFFSAGSVIFIYLLACLVIPREADTFHSMSPPTMNGQAHASTSYSHYSMKSTMDHTNSDLDSVVKDLETKAMRKEIEELKERLKRYEKGDV